MEPTSRLYFEDAYLTTFEARVVGRRPTDGGMEIALDRTAFYPEGGGQPPDTGRLDKVPITDVQVEDGIVWHTARQDIEGDQITGVIDWQRRFDHMQQHHGQHLLSAAFENLFSIATTSFHLGPKSVTIDLDAPELLASQLRDAERTTNDIVWANHPVVARFVGPEKLTTIPLRKPPTVSGDVRVVSVAGFDYSACGGTHPSRTGAVGMVFVIGHERRGQQARVEFACGNRALECLRASHNELKRVARELTVGTDEVFDTTLRLRDDEVRVRKELGKAQRSLCEFEAANLLALARHIGTDPIVCQQFDDRDGSELQELTRSLSGLEAYVILGTTGKTAQIFVARPHSKTTDCGALLKETLARLGGRGGGRPEMARGGLPNEQLAQAIQLLEAELTREIEPGP